MFSAFTFAYALFEIPTGWLGDKIGPRKVLMRVVLWWSFFTAATGWAWNSASMIGHRDFCSARVRRAVSQISPKPSARGCPSATAPARRR